ncbi:MAG TPA: hypothetical protein VF658_21305 [Pyrinomonadaceae bacterium]|jgi:hypothetical protein
MSSREFEDDALFKLKSLPLWLEGLDLTDPKLIRGAQEFLRFHEQEIEYKRRKVSDGFTKFVYQLSEKPPAYCFHPYFEGTRQIVEELNMPCDLDRLCFLRYFHGGDFSKYQKRYSKKFKRYAVEALGIRTWGPDFNPFKKETCPPPDPSQYKHPPMYWYEDRWCLVQVWRIRVFDCPLETIQVPLSNPLMPYLPPVLKCEWRWRPNNVSMLDFFERQQLHTFGRSKLQSFYKYCKSVTGGEIKRGRPNEYTDKNSFVQDFTDAYQLLDEGNETSPRRSLIADELLIDRKTLRYYLNHFNVSFFSLL